MINYSNNLIPIQPPDNQYSTNIAMETPKKQTGNNIQSDSFVTPQSPVTGSVTTTTLI